MLYNDKVGTIDGFQYDSYLIQSVEWDLQTNVLNVKVNYIINKGRKTKLKSYLFNVEDKKIQINKINENHNNRWVRFSWIRVF
jgi:hypothetical protein